MMLYNNFSFVSNLRHEWHECTIDLNKILSESVITLYMSLTLQSRSSDVASPEDSEQDTSELKVTDTHSLVLAYIKCLNSQCWTIFHLLYLRSHNRYIVRCRNVLETVTV